MTRHLVKAIFIKDFHRCNDYTCADCWAKVYAQRGTAQYGLAGYFILPESWDAAVAYHRKHYSIDDLADVIESHRRLEAAIGDSVILRWVK